QTVALTDNSTTSDYHALQVKFQRRLSRRLQGLSSYTFSHSIDSASTDAFSTYLNTPGTVANPNVDRGHSDFDIRNGFTAGVIYDLPSPASGKVIQAISRGWSVDAFVLARSAAPVNVVVSTFRANGIALNPRPNVNSGVPLELYGDGYPG